MRRTFVEVGAADEAVILDAVDRRRDARLPVIRYAAACASRAVVCQRSNMIAQFTGARAMGQSRSLIDLKIPECEP